ncbi:M1 family metallopeptidase [Balneola vulgaris]|uniref:M1 family metallopeptidase n=1 Tax=Balneola vulgaris TaxID=287535 RepID=UPI0003A9A743|nr:M1 family metallopeptidase [Balneola vulgaris]
MKYLLTLLLFLSMSISGVAQQSTGYWQQSADYTMEIDVDAKNHQYSGKQKLVYTNNSPDELNKVYYHLYFNAFQPGSMMDVRSRNIADPDRRVGDRISKLSEDEIGYQRIRTLKQDGKPVKFTTEGTILVVELNKAIKPGKKSTFEMEWDAQVPLQIRRSGWNNAEGIELSMSQWYPKMAEYDYMGWHPNPYIGREFHGIWGDFDVKISIDKDYVIGATGILQNPNEVGHGYEKPGSKVNRPKGDKITYHFVAENVIDFFWGADPDFVHTTAQVPNGPKLHFFYQKDVVTGADPQRNAQFKENWERLPELTVKAFTYAMEKFGRYPYPQFSVVQGGDGGMEYPMGTLITGGRSLGSLVGVTVHEFFHSWYQGVLATNEALYPWMDEGFTSFASSETMAYTFNREGGNVHAGSYGGYISLAKSGLEEPMTTHADHYNTNRAYGSASYSKGAVYLGQLSYIMGDETFRRAFLRYFNEWKFKHPTPNDLLRIMEQESGMILDWYNEYFVSTTKTIDYGIRSVLGAGSSTKVELERIGLMPMPIDLEVEYMDGSKEIFYMPLRIMRGEKPAENDTKRTVLEDWPWTNPTYTVEIPTSASNIKTITIDPTRRLADIEPSNNTFDVEGMIKK